MNDGNILPNEQNFIFTFFTDTFLKQKHLFLVSYTLLLDH